MTRFRNRIAVWSSLHVLTLIYGSSHGSVFESPLYRVHNGTNSDRVRVSRNGQDLTKLFRTLFISLRTANQSALRSFMTVIHAANRRDNFSSSGEKHMMRFMRALQRLVIFGGSSDIACFWASVMSGPTSCHFMIDFSFFPHALLLFQEQLMLNGQNTHEMDHSLDAVRQMNLVCIYMETIGSFWSQWLRWLWIEVG